MRNEQAIQLIFELSQPGRRATRFPEPDVPHKPLGDYLPAELLADAPAR